jgi:hypothetical protein
LGVVANRFPGKKLHWDNATQQFSMAAANLLLDGKYRAF